MSGDEKVRPAPAVYDMGFLSLPAEVQAEAERAVSVGVGRACPEGPHRGPEGPNEDLGQCGVCWSVSYELRPEGETYGDHLPDCSLPRRHESYCRPGGGGHPAAPVIRGYW